MDDSRLHLRQLADFAAQLRHERIPASAVTLIKHVLLDSLGCAFAADGLDPGSGIVSTVFAVQASGDACTIFSTGGRTETIGAALVNGALVHALNFDPVGARSGHTGVACMAAPFAMAEARGASGRGLVTAAIVAAEISARITCAIVAAGRRPSDKFLGGQLLSYFGAAAGAAHLMGLDAERMESALCLALMQASGSRQVIFGGDAPAKSIYGAFPAAGAITAALLAGAGLDARCDLFGAPAGLYASFYGGGIDTAGITAGLYEHYAFMDAEFKPWPASSHIIPFIEAAIQASQALPDLAKIESITLVGPPHGKPWLEPLAPKLAPQNVAAAGNSGPYCAAVALSEGHFDFAFADPARAPDIASIAALLRVAYDDAITGARIVVRMQDGTTRTCASDAPLGSLANPLSEAQHVEKFMRCCALSRNANVRRNATALAAAFVDLENISDVRVITRLMRDAEG